MDSLKRMTESEERPGYLAALALLAILAMAGAFWRMGERISLLGNASPSDSDRQVSGSAAFAVIDAGQKPLRVEIARTPAEHYQGLSDRPSLCPDCGMLFLFPASQPRNFVMRRMNFPLDMVWLNDGVIVSIDRKLAPEAAEPYTPYGPGQPINAVLEMNAGAAERYNLAIGQTLQIPR